MKLRQQAKRIAAMRAKRPKRVPWTAEGNKAFRLLMQRSRFVHRYPVDNLWTAQ